MAVLYVPSQAGEVFFTRVVQSKEESILTKVATAPAEQ